MKGEGEGASGVMGHQGSAAVLGDGGNAVHASAVEAPAHSPRSEVRRPKGPCCTAQHQKQPARSRTMSCTAFLTACPAPTKACLT